MIIKQVSRFNRFREIKVVAAATKTRKLLEPMELKHSFEPSATPTNISLKLFYLILNEGNKANLLTSALAF
jgi:hypothetical protein